MNSNDLASQYPHLFQQVTWLWGPTRAHFVLLEKAPPGDKIANVNIVPHIGDQWVMLHLADGSWEIPGGTLEPEENYQEAILRELMEEVGAILISHHVIGAWQCLSLADKPYRPHLPFPEYFRLVIAGEIQIVNSPGNPSRGEKSHGSRERPIGSRRIQVCLHPSPRPGRTISIGIQIPQETNYLPELPVRTFITDLIGSETCEVSRVYTTPPGWLMPFI